MKHFFFYLLLTTFFALFAQENPVETKLEELRKEGIPTTLEEIEKLYPKVEDTENSVIEFNQAFALLENKERETQLMDVQKEYASYSEKYETPLPPETQQKLKEYLTKNKDILTLLHQGNEKPKSYYSIQFTDGFNAKLPSLLRARYACNILTFQCALSVEENQPDLAIKAIEVQLKLAQGQMEIPILISVMIGSALQHIAIKNAQRVLNRFSLSKEQLEWLQKLFQQPEKSEHIAAAFTAEMCIGIDIFEKIRNGTLSSGYQEQVGLEKMKMFFYRASGNFQKDNLFYLDIFSRQIEILKNKNLSQRFRAIKELAKRIERINSSYLVSNIVLPNYSRLIETDIERIVLLQLLNVALTVEQYRFDQKKLPESLSVLKEQSDTDSLQDAFSIGKTFQYKMLPVGYLIYSVGPNQKDDSGVVEEKKLDLVFSVKR